MMIITFTQYYEFNKNSRDFPIKIKKKINQSGIEQFLFHLD